MAIDVETPLLASENQKSLNYSLTTLKCDFLSNLPAKVKAQLDPEAPNFHLQTIALTQGCQISTPIFHYS